MGRKLTRLVIAGVILLSAPRVTWGSEPADPGACGADLPAQIGISDCRLARSVADGIQRSATLRKLVDRMGELKGRVYVTTAVSAAAGANRPLLGALSHKTVMAGEYCLLRVTVLHAYDDNAVATIAHELRHAVEVLENPEARTEADVDALFERIGQRVSAGIVETQAALDTEHRVAQELKLAHAHSRRRSPANGAL
jgi:hypothetical protein